MNLILDTGPLVALLNRRDTNHEWALTQVGDAKAPILTCEPVLSEACHLVRRLAGGPGAVIKLLRRNLLATPFRLDEECPRIERLLKKYADVPMSLADACLVRMTEHLETSVVMTLDRDFLVYRRNGRQVIPTISPW